jgi:hypothetical protein
MEFCKYVLVGDENYDNLRLSQILKQTFNKENVSRFLELQYLESFLIRHQEYPIIVCLDLFSFDLKKATDTVGYIRDKYPKVVFNLYLDHEEYNRRSHEIPEHWQHRFLHYFKTFKEGPDVEYEPIVRASLRPSQNEAMYNMAYEPIRLTPVFKRGLVDPQISAKQTSETPTSFISYSRDDWNGFVAGLVSDLVKDSHKVWVDQNYIIGGDDWMDAIGEALQVCDTLLLVLSPDSLNSKFVKMEYRFFFHQGKPIIPILYRNVNQMPFELATLQYIDFTKEDKYKCNSTLFSVLSRI